MTDHISIKQVLVDFLKENKASVAGYLFFSLAGPISNIYLPHLYGKIISAINEKKGIDREVKIRFAMIFMLWVLVQFFWASMNVIDSHFIPKLRSHIRKYIVDKVLDAYREDYEEEELGGVLAEVVRLPDEVDHMFTSIRNHVMPMTFMLIFSIGYFTWTNPMIGAASVVAIGVYLTIAFKFSQRCIPIWSDMNDSHRDLHDQINDCLGNLLNIYTANGDQTEQDRLDRYESHFKERHRRTIRCAGDFRLTLNLSHIFLFCSVNILSFFLFSKGMMQLSEVISILIISLELISKMAGFIGAIDRVMYEMSIIKDVQHSLDTLSERHTRAAAQKTPVRYVNVDLNGDIKFQNITLKYGDSLALDDINLTLTRGETVVLMGEIGSGKTSLVNAMLRLLPYTGTIEINGYDTKELTLDNVRNQVLYVPQNPRLFNRTIYENISYGNDTPKEEVARLLKRYGLKIDLERTVGKYGQSLSGGQRQIVYLLRCFFKNAPIIILDEPTASLDKDTKHQILGLLTELLRNRTVIIISHDPDVLGYCERRIVLDKGRLIK